MSDQSYSLHPFPVSAKHRARLHTDELTAPNPNCLLSLMAALRRIPRNILGQLAQPNPNYLPSCSLQPSPSLFISRRGIASKLFVGGLSFYTTEKGLVEAFSKYGQVVEAKVVMDRVSDRSKGFGFVTFASEDEAEKARTEMDGKALNGRVVFVDYAKPQTNFGGGMPIARGPPEIIDS